MNYYRTQGDTEYDITAFLVDKDAPGVSTSDSNMQTGVKAADGLYTWFYTS